jgi:signal transduction histidine kinase
LNVIIVRAKQNPFQLAFMIAAILGGLALLILRQRLGSTLAQELPTPITVILGAGLVAGAGTTLIGMWMQRVAGLLLERAGLLILTILFIVYAAFTVDFTGLKGLIIEVFFGSFAVASAFRALQIASDLRQTEQEIKAAVAQQGAQQEGGDR